MLTALPCSCLLLTLLIGMLNWYRMKPLLLYATPAGHKSVGLTDVYATCHLRARDLHAGAISSCAATLEPSTVQHMHPCSPRMAYGSAPKLTADLVLIIQTPYGLKIGDMYMF